MIELHTLNVGPSLRPGGHEGAAAVATWLRANEIDGDDVLCGYPIEVDQNHITYTAPVRDQPGRPGRQRGELATRTVRVPLRVGFPTELAQFFHAVEEVA